MIRYFVRHPVAANLLMFLVCLLGAAFLSDIERETFPEFSASAVNVSVAYPGASARDVDEEICRPIEDALTGIDGLSDLQCLSVDGRGSATAEMSDGGDIILFFNDIFSAVSTINDFPADAESPAVQVQSRADLVALVAVSGVAGKQGLVAYSDELADRLLRLDGVASATVSGISDREIRIVFDEESLRSHGLSASSLVDAINARSFSQPLGNADLDDSSIVLRYADARRSVSQLEDLIVLQNSTGGIVRLRDMAEVIIVDSDENVESYIDGQQAAIISISKSADDDSIRVFNAVSQLLDAERSAYPDPFQLTVINNLSDVVKERLELILQNIVLGLVLVFSTMWLFFSLRDALWISASLPVSFLGSLFVMSVLGITINMISLVALLMAVGLIMDDSIVIAENIAKWRRKTNALEAATRGTLEVLPSVFSSFLTTACVFGPLMFLSGDMGQILRIIPMVLLITLSLSLIEGFLILPHHLSRSDGKAGKTRPAERLLNRFKEGALLPLATKLTEWRYLTVGTVIALFMLSIGLIASGAIKVIGFPASESDTVQIRLSLTSGINRDRTVQTVDTLLAALDKVDTELTPLTHDAAPLVERVLVQYGVNSEVNDNGSNTATITVDLLESSLRNVRADDFLQAWREAAGPIPDLVQSSFSQAEQGPGGLDLDVELRGRDLAVLESASETLLNRLLERNDVTEAFQDFYGGREELRFALTPYGYSLGLTPRSLADQLRNAFEGSETDSFTTDLSDVSVRVQLGDTLSSLTDIESFPVTTGNGRQLALSEVTDTTLTTGYPTIIRKNGLAMARIQGKIDTSVTTSALISAVVIDELAPVMQQEFPGIQIGIGGATEAQNESQSSLMKLMLMGLIGVYLVLAFQFRSYTLPVVIMFAIPFALVGTILGHWVLGLNISMPSLIGFASLAGIVVNNAILFLTFFETHLQGDDYVSASLDAVRARFQPVILSTATTFAGLIPIIAETSPQVQTMVPLVVSVAFGLLASMLMVTLVFPSLISIYFDLFNVRKWARQTR